MQIIIEKRLRKQGGHTSHEPSGVAITVGTRSIIAPKSHLGDTTSEFLRDILQRQASERSHATESSSTQAKIKDLKHTHLKQKKIVSMA